MTHPVRLLLVNGAATAASPAPSELRPAGRAPICSRVRTAAELAAALDASSWDILLATHSLHPFGAMAALAMLRERGIDLPVIAIMETIRPEDAAAVMHAGARDYVPKDDFTRLALAIERELADLEARRARALVEQATRFQARLADCINQAVIATDMNGTIRYW